MTLHPIRILDQVLDEYRDYLLTEFRAKDPNLRAALERELDAPGFLAQDTFYQAHRPFRTGSLWRDLPLNPKLAAVMEKRSRSPEAYLHQSLAIEQLLSSAANPVVVTTGTGSGKTEAFLLPVIQNAFEDSVRFKKSGLTAILVYPMNALANDQRQRIEDYLNEAGMAGAIRVEQYDRGTSQTKRQEMRANPPHILLTNYMMLEYLLVRPADREDIFANHRCRFLVLDEVHTYRGILGTNIALLVRRVRTHLARARQDWKPDVPATERPKRYPKLIPIGTSATIKSLFEEGLSREEVIRLRDESVKEFFGNLTGADRDSIRVFGEELKELQIPSEAVYPRRAGQVRVRHLQVSDVEIVRQALCSLAQLPENTPLNDAASRYRLLWDLNRWLIKRPMSVSQIVEVMRAEVPQRADCTGNELRAEVEAALVIGAALPDETPGALRLRAHRFVRGGWKFHRCVNPNCGRLYPKGEERCTSCNHVTAPLYLCRNCGADYLRFAGDIESEPLRPTADVAATLEWMVYEPSKFDSPVAAEEDEDDREEAAERPPRRGRARVPTQIRRRPVLEGSLDPTTLLFSTNPDEYPWVVTLSPARTRCLCCGGTAGSRNVITPLALGTSAAVKVLSEGLVEGLTEANGNRPGHDGKERLLLFSDSRQDAAHQARFIIFASRYDRMRRRLMEHLLREQELTVQRAVELLSESAVSQRDNPYVPLETDWIPEDARNRVQAWEEAPLLDEIAVNAGYRATLVNLGLVGIRYHQLDEYVQAKGEDLAEALGVDLPQLTYICRVMLDEMRVRGALSRPMLQYHPAHISCPAHLHAAEWERTVKQPRGYPLTRQGQVVAVMDGPTISGVTVRNAWRRPRSGGRGPSLERILRHLLHDFGGNEPDDQMMTDMLRFLRDGSFILPYTLYGYRESMQLLQVNAETIRLHVLNDDTRLHCEVCGDVRSGPHAGMPCSQCHGRLVLWADTDVELNRTVRRIRKTEAVPLVAGEHTAQITTDARAELETNFKAAPDVSPVNVLACSPTLEMGIDVGGLDAVVMRNVPPRPDNYAQRGGRAGRRSRVGMVVGYARNTPHDQYFYDKPAEMIGGEVPAPALSLGNRDVLIRHLHGIIFGAAQPGLAGRMIEYVGPDGAINHEAVDGLIQGVQAQKEHAAEMARQAWGDEILARAGIDEQQLREHLNELPDRIHHVINATSRQVIELRQALDSYARSLEGRHAGVRAGDLVARLLGIQTASRPNIQDADDRSAGYPLRRFAEFGLLPGYEFPSEPATLRLLGDEHEEDPISVTRRFGLGQFQPEAHVYARKRRWVVIGLDNASPWNPRSDGPTWSYRVCGTCGLRYNADEPSCPRCGTSSPGPADPAFEFAGFLAKKEERPILDEEDRYAARNLVTVHPQWTGDVVGRWSLVNGWGLRLSRNEEVRWINEGLPPTQAEIANQLPILHVEAKGYLLCPSCGRKLEPPPPPQVQSRGRRNAGGRAGRQDTGGHADGCPLIGTAPRALAITTAAKVEVLRLLMPVPGSDNARQWLSLGLSLGYALLNGMQRRFMLDPAELEFQLEGPWNSQQGEARCSVMSLAFIDPGLGGSGYLERIAEDFHLVAERALEHLDHAGCDTACYRCLKTYQNQRYHDQLHWPSAIPALHELAEQAPTGRPLQTGDMDDPRPWLEAYAAGLGSPLELKFLQLFEKYGFKPEKQVPVSPTDDEPPISVADFAVPERRLAIYVDGAAFHIGANLRRDRYIRGRLRDGQPPWRVEELRASDLKAGESLIRRLKESI
ncbi:MAG: DEAD/DEAH box helicase [Thermodesulfobacteriota bacterium]